MGRRPVRRVRLADDLLGEVPRQHEQHAGEHADRPAEPGQPGVDPQLLGHLVADRRRPAARPRCHPARAGGRPAASRRPASPDPTSSRPLVSSGSRERQALSTRPASRPATAPMTTNQASALNHLPRSFSRHRAALRGLGELRRVRPAATRPRRPDHPEREQQGAEHDQRVTAGRAGPTVSGRVISRPGSPGPSSCLRSANSAGLGGHPEPVVEAHHGGRRCGSAAAAAPRSCPGGCRARP